MSPLDVTQWGMSPTTDSETELTDLQALADIVYHKLVEEVESALALSRQISERDNPIRHLLALLNLRLSLANACRRADEDMERFAPKEAT